MATYNLAHIYFFNEAGITDDKRAFNLLIFGVKKDIPMLADFCALILMKKCKIQSYEEIKKEISNDDLAEYFTRELYIMIKAAISEPNIYGNLYDITFDELKDLNLVYYHDRIENQTTKKKMIIKDKRIDIKSSFYEGFGDI